MQFPDYSFAHKKEKIPAEAIYYGDITYLPREIVRVIRNQCGEDHWYYLPRNHFYYEYLSPDYHDDDTLIFEKKCGYWEHVERSRWHGFNEVKLFRYFDAEPVSRQMPAFEPAPVPKPIIPVTPFKPYVVTMPEPDSHFTIKLVWVGGEPITDEDFYSLHDIRDTQTRHDMASGYVSPRKIQTMTSAYSKYMDVYVDSQADSQLICPELKHPRHRITFKDCKDKQCYTAYLLYPPVRLNCSVGGWPTWSKFEAHTLEYFKRQGNNATLFIHGFNVANGVSGNLYSGITVTEGEHGPLKEPAPKLVLGDKSFARNTVLTDEARFESLYPEAKNENYKDLLQAMRGTHSYEWQQCAEMQLNQAAGFNGDYTTGDYTRIAMVHWSGDVYPVNYIEAEHHAEHAGALLADALKQLVDEKIEVNIIAHSLGNRVLLSALHHLMKKHGDAYKKAINHIFMWQPAVPDTALSTDPKDDASILQNWQYTRATEAVEYITVLHSRNDNVLGPLNRDKETGLLSNLGNKFIELFTLGATGSVYELATHIGHPVLDIFMQQGFETWYATWRRRYPRMRTGHFFPEDGNLVISPYTYTAFGITLHLCNKIHENTLKYFNIEGVSYPSISRFVKILYFTDYTSGTLPRKAMGYGGVEEKLEAKLRQTGRFFPVNQTKWLFEHSGMKDPSPEVFQKSYKEAILGTRGWYQLGKYPSSAIGKKA